MKLFSGKSFFIFLVILFIAGTIVSCKDKQKKEEQEDFEKFYEWVEPDPEQYKNYINLGKYFTEKGNYKKAKRYFRKALELEPESFEAHFFLAFAHEQTFNYVLAKKEYRKALRLQPDSIRAHLNYGLVIYKNDYDDYPEALQEFNWVLEREPDNYLALYNIAVIYNRVDPDRAIDYWKRYIDIAQHIPGQEKNVVRAMNYLNFLEKKHSPGEGEE